MARRWKIYRHLDDARRKGEGDFDDRRHHPVCPNCQSRHQRWPVIVERNARTHRWTTAKGKRHRVTLVNPPTKWILVNQPAKRSGHDMVAVCCHEWHARRTPAENQTEPDGWRQMTTDEKFDWIARAAKTKARNRRRQGKDQR